MNITPINNCLLVKLTEAYELVETIDVKYGTKTSGIVIATDGHDELLGMKAYFKDFSDGTQIDDGDDKYALIDYDEVRGYKEI